MMTTEEKSLATVPAGEKEAPGQEELLRSLAEQSALQTAMAAKQLRLARLSTLFVGVMAAAAVFFVAAALPRVSATLTQADAVLGSLGQVAAQLEEAGLPEILANLDLTLTEGQQSLQDASLALEKVSQIDFASLNRAIQDLSALLDNPLGAIFR